MITLKTFELNKGIPITGTSVHAYKIPTEESESDGTLQWDHTILVLVEIKAADKKGIGYTYADVSSAHFIREHLFPVIRGEDIMDNTQIWDKMNHEVRNLGRPGISSMAISAVDTALWDLKAKCLELPLCKLLGQKHKNMPVYASGGFTSYDASELFDKFSKEREKGHARFKMKIGRSKIEDIKRLQAARNAIEGRDLFVDANGAYFPKEAIEMSEELQRYKVSWFEEPVTSDDLRGMHMVRQNISARTKVAAGEYGYTVDYFKSMLESSAVDVLQADATRCGGITGFMKVSELCEAFHVPFSAHCAPSLHLHPSLSIKNMIHVEYFRDHVRIEEMLFDGYARAENGIIYPDLNRNGLGLEFKFNDAEKFKMT